jgi:hypothetical protein
LPVPALSFNEIWKRGSMIQFWLNYSHFSFNQFHEYKRFAQR